MGIISTIASFLNVGEASHVAHYVNSFGYAGRVENGIGEVSGDCYSDNNAEARARVVARILCAVEGGGEPVQPVHCSVYWFGRRFDTEIRCNEPGWQPLFRKVLGLWDMRPHIEAIGGAIVATTRGINNVVLHRAGASEPNTAGFAIKTDNGNLDGRTSFRFNVKDYDSSYGPILVDLYDEDGTRILHAVPVISSEGEDNFIMDFSTAVDSISEIRFHLPHQHETDLTLIFDNLRFEYKTVPRSWFVSKLRISEEDLNMLLQLLFRNPSEENLVLSADANSREEINTILEELNVINDWHRQIVADELSRYYELY